MPSTKIRYFIGLKRKNTSTVICSLLWMNEYNKLKQLEPISFQQNYCLSKHRACLYAILEALNISSEKYNDNYELIIYTLIEEIRFEWMTEYKEDKKFSNQTKDKDLWDRIAEFTSKKNIKLVIESKESPLTGLIITRRRNP